MKDRNHQSGFAAIEAVLIIIVIAIIGGTGYFIYHANKSSDKTLTSSAPASPPAPATPAAPAQATTAVKTTFSKVPVDLRTAIVAAYKNVDTSCVKGNQIIDSTGAVVDPDLTYQSPSFAVVNVDCGDGGSAHLFVKVSGVWKDVEDTQFAFSCDTLKQYKVPTSLLSVANAGQSDPLQCVPASADDNAALPDYTGPTQS